VPHVLALVAPATRGLSAPFSNATAIPDTSHLPAGRASLADRSFGASYATAIAPAGSGFLYLGNDDHAPVTALQFPVFTSRVGMLTNAQVTEIGTSRASLQEHGVGLIEGTISRVRGRGGIVEATELTDGRSLETDDVFSLQGSTPNSELAICLGLATDPAG
jgi:hypothetical protein